MIDLDVSLAASEEKRGAKAWFECGNLSYCDINELITRLRQAEKDAARYRWLRDEAIEHQDSGPLIIFSDSNGEPCSFGDCGSIISHDDADKAIDEAMQCK